VDGTWALLQRHKLRSMYFSTSQSRTRILTGKHHDWRHHLPHRRQHQATNDTTIIELAYEYVFMKAADLRMAGIAGIHSIQFDYL